MKIHLAEFDYIRAIAAFSVIAIHTTGWYITSMGYGYLMNLFMRYAVPLFIMLSGLMLKYSDKKKNDLDYLSFLNKRLSKILFPYILWTIIYTLYYYRHDLGALTGTWGKFLNIISDYILHGNASYHMYFPIIILQMYFLYPNIKLLLKEHSPIMLTGSFLITFYFQLSENLLNFGIKIMPSSPIRGLPYFMMFPTWLFYFVLGMYLAGHLDKLQNFVIRRSKVLIILWGTNYLALFFEWKITGNFVNSVQPTLIPYTILSFAVLYYAGLKLKDRIASLDKLIYWLSLQSFFIYFAHPIVMEYIFKIAYRLKIGSLFENRLSYLLYFAVTSIATPLLALFLSFLPCTSLLGLVRDKRLTNIINRLLWKNRTNSISDTKSF